MSPPTNNSKSWHYLIMWFPLKKRTDTDDNIETFVELSVKSIQRLTDITMAIWKRNNGRQNSTQKTIYWATRTPQKKEVNWGDILVFCNPIYWGDILVFCNPTYWGDILVFCNPTYWGDILVFCNPTYWGDILVFCNPIYWGDILVFCNPTYWGDILVFCNPTCIWWSWYFVLSNTWKSLIERKKHA
jgi:multimeric flavodoxin WrbA